MPKSVFQSGLVLMDALITLFERHRPWPKGVNPMWRIPNSKICPLPKEIFQKTCFAISWNHANIDWISVIQSNLCLGAG